MIRLLATANNVDDNVIKLLGFGLSQRICKTSCYYIIQLYGYHEENHSYSLRLRVKDMCSSMLVQNINNILGGFEPKIGKGIDSTV